MRVKIGKRHVGLNRRNGFSLIEAAIGMAVVGIVCVALYSGLTSGLATVRLSRENERATQILTEKLDTIRLYSWDKITNPDFIPTTFTKLYDPTSKLGITYTGTVSIGKVPLETPYSTNMRQVTVTLQWTTGSLSRQRSMTTMVAKDGMQNYIY
jgi:type II secretory pathway pseudopilin PulG